MLEYSAFAWFWNRPDCGFCLLTFWPPRWVNFICKFKLAFVANLNSQKSQSTIPLPSLWGQSLYQLSLYSSPNCFPQMSQSKLRWTGSEKIISRSSSLLSKLQIKYSENKKSGSNELSIWVKWANNLNLAQTWKFLKFCY